jgi:peptide/nickel transport system ATP-binding protein
MDGLVSDFTGRPPTVHNPAHGKQVGMTEPATVRPLVAISGLRVAFDGVPALRGIDLAVHQGEAVGLVGESGCGKSVTWLAALGLLGRAARVTGSVTLAGEELLGASPATLDRVRGGRIAMIFQDPATALNPVHKVGRQVAESLRLHRAMDHAAAAAEARRLFDMVGIPDAGRRLHAYPHEMSGGQNQRVMIAMALAGQPELLIADEPTTALDATIQAQILDLLRRLQAETGMALVLISHDLGVVADMCSRVGVMYAGRLVEQAPAEALFAHPAHPYTQGLLGALPDMIGPRRRLSAIPGGIPEPWNLPPGCAFAPRCPAHTPACDSAEPAARPAGRAHQAACIHLAPATVPA